MIEDPHSDSTAHSAQISPFPDLGGLKDPALETLLGIVTASLRILLNIADERSQLTNDELERPLLTLLRSKRPHDRHLQSDQAFETLVSSIITQSPPHRALSQSAKAELLRRATARLNSYTGRRLYTMPRNGPFYAPLEFIRDPGAVFPMHDWQKQPIVTTELGDLHISVSEDCVELCEAQRVHIWLAGEDNEPISYGEFQIIRGDFRGPSAERNFIMAADQIGESVATSACDLVAQYSAAELFRDGDLVMVEAFEVAQARLGESLGIRFLEHALTYLKRCWPTLRSLSVCSEPYQFLYAPADFRPQSIKAARNKERLVLEQYLEMHKQRVLQPLSDVVAPAKGFIFTDKAIRDAEVMMDTFAATQD